MKKLITHLRPFTWSIVIIFVLLFAQAMSDLSLPAYMADIVNVGIQQGGIENSVPQAIRQSEMNKLATFMSAEEKSEIYSSYTLLDRATLSGSDYQHYQKIYPQLASEPVFILNNNSEIGANKLNSIFSLYIPLVYTLENNNTSMFKGTPLEIPEGMDPFSFISGLSSAQISTLRQAIQQQSSKMPQSMFTQYAANYIAAEYKAIGMDITNIQTMYMLRIGGLMLLLTLFSAACSISVGYLSARVAAGLGRDLRRKLFVRVESFSSAEFDKFSTASLITRSTNDITQIQMLMVMLLRIAFYAPMMALGGIIRVAGVETSMLWIIAVAVGAALTLQLIVFTVAVPRFILIQKLADKLNLITREMLTGLMVVRAFNTQQHEENRFDHSNMELTRTSLFVNKVMVFMMPSMMFIMNAVMLLIIWIGAGQIDTGALQVGNMMAFMQYTVLIIFSFMMISFMFIMVPRASVSANRISEVLETEPTINDPARPQNYGDDIKGLVEFQNVSFSYPGAEDDLLKNISFTAKPGQTTAFIGSTGSGKSTVVNLIPRFYDVTGGRVLVDGLDIREVSQHDLRDKIGYVSQNAVLFSGTIRSNIKYASEEATDSEIAGYVETAQALDFIDTSDQGFDYYVSQGGKNLSGGQKQRLSIARALAKKPEIYIFDDSLSALDYKTDAAIRKALKKETSNATVLIVTQRVSTIMGAEQIVVLDKGEIAGIGTHNTLMETCEVYREIAQSQLTPEELG